MNRILRRLFIMFLVPTSLIGTTLPLSAKNAPSTTVTNLKVQATATPLSVEDKNPVFSWQMVSAAIGQKQSAYQIVVTREGEKSIA